MSDEAHEATPDHELERQIMSYNEAKNEREWWAMHEIERLRKAIRIAYGIIDECSPHRLKELNDVVVREGK